VKRRVRFALILVLTLAGGLAFLVPWGDGEPAPREPRLAVQPDDPPAGEPRETPGTESDPGDDAAVRLPAPYPETDDTRERLVPAQGQTLHGEIVFLDGQPVPGHAVRVEGRTFGPSIITADSEGRFAVQTDEPLVISCEGAVAARQECPPDVTTVRVVLERSVLVVRVVDEHSEPVRQPRIDIETREGLLKRNRPTERVLVAPGERVVVTVAKRGYRTATRTVEPWGQRPALHEEVIRLEPNEDASVALKVTIEGGRVPRHVRVTVRDGQGRTLQPRHFTTEGDPIVRVGGLSAGTVRLEVCPLGDPLLRRVVETEAVTENREPIEVTLPTGSAFRLTWPAAPRRVKIRIRGVSLEAETYAKNIGGVFRGASRLPPGEYELTAVLGKEQLRQERFTATAGNPVELKWTD
jgi:hypothetical protein